MKRILLLLLLLFVIDKSIAQNIYFPPLSGNDWESISPQSLGLNSNKLDSLKKFLNDKNSKAFIILKDGKIVVEWYFDNFTKDSIWYWASANKSLTSFLIGIAQEEGLLKINDKSSKYLGQGWTSAPAEKEDMITIRHQLTMTTGLDDAAGDADCTLKGCLQYKTDAGARWAYHNAPYTLLGSVIENAANTTRNEFTRSRVASKIGMNGLWLNIDYNDVYFSNARSMARYGLLVYNNGVWDKDTLLHDSQYLYDMVNSSQELNKSYGYLWWLNGKGSYMLPGMQFVFKKDLIPEAPDDLFAALGKNDQKIYIVKSMGLVIVRMGEVADAPFFALSSFDNDLWTRIMQLFSNSTGLKTENKVIDGYELKQNYPNPFNPSTKIKYSLDKNGFVNISVFDVLGRHIAQLVSENKTPGEYEIVFNSKDIPSGVYFCRIKVDKYSNYIKMVLSK